MKDRMQCQECEHWFIGPHQKIKENTFGLCDLLSNGISLGLSIFITAHNDEPDVVDYVETMATWYCAEWKRKDNGSPK